LTPKEDCAIVGAHRIVIKTPLLQILRERRLTTQQLGDAVGLSPRTIHNVACGSSKSRTARQKIVNYLGVSPWQDIKVTQRFCTFPTGTEIEYRSAKEARECAADELAAGIVRQRGRVLTFVRAATFTVDIDTPKQSAKKPKDRRELKRMKTMSSYKLTRQHIGSVDRPVFISDDSAISPAGPFDLHAVPPGCPSTVQGVLLRLLAGEAHADDPKVSCDPGADLNRVIIEFLAISAADIARAELICKIARRGKLL
jgi:transcriptional regulator with XRE-family HTH domain